MAKYQQYEEYKDSGVEWLGGIPSHWEAKRLGQFFKERREKVSDKDYAALSVTMKGIVPQLENAAKSDAGDNRKLVLKNDFVINSRSDRKGSSGTSPFDGSVSLISIVLEPRDISPRFVHHLLRSYPFQEEFYRYGKGIVADLWSTNSSEMKNILIPNIPIDEQTQIANFLDYETAQIDTLIEKQQTLIQLLKEKRQAVISHAVTKGLNPDAPMKDSGVEWLGEVPEHWEVSKLKYYSSIQGGYAFSSDSFTEEGVQILKIGNVYQNRLALERQPTFVPEVMLEALPDFIVKDGDILMSLTGTLGKRDYGFAVAIKDDGKYLLNQRVAKLNPADEKIDRDFLLNVLWSESYLNQLYSLPSGTKQANLSNSDVLDIVITLPPSKTEQKEIAVELQNQKDTFDKAIQKAMTSIELMQERRTALISAAVTGKIDVRGWRAPE